MVYTAVCSLSLFSFFSVIFLKSSLTNFSLITFVLILF